MNKKMRSFRLTAGLLVAFVAAAMIAPTSAIADPGGWISDVLIKVEAENGDKKGSVEISMVGVASYAPNEPIVWTAPDEIQIWSDDESGTLLGTLTSLSTFIDPDPVIALGFAVTAPSTGVNYTISSAILNFPAMLNPVGVATAAITVTDSDGSGVTATPGFAGNTKFYQASTNLGVFAELVSGPLSAPGLDSNAANERYPAVGDVLIPGSVNWMSTQFSFHLSAYDQASGTSAFSVVPEPGSMLALGTGLVGMAGVLFRRRR